MTTKPPLPTSHFPLPTIHSPPLPTPVATLECGPFRLRFVRQADRIGQWIDVRDSVDGSWRKLTHSVEGTPNDIWPSSPPWQHLHLEKRSTGPVALLLGMSGQAHWSGSIRATADGFLWELACRTPGPAEFLGNTWHSDNDVSSSPAWQAVDCRISIAQEVERTILRVTPCTGPFPVTVQWNFLLKVPDLLKTTL